MAESDPPTRKPAAKRTKAQAEFARYKDQGEQPGAGAAFASPLPTSAIPAWSLQPAPVAPAPPGAGPGAGPGPWGPAPPSGTGYASIVEGVGTTLRLGVEVLNAALSSSLQMLGGVGEAALWGHEPCGCSDCGGACGYDCCSVLGCGGGCCEPSVGTCC